MNTQVKRTVKLKNDAVLKVFADNLAVQGKTKNTIAAYCSRLKMFFKATDCDPFEINAENIRRYFWSMRNLSDATKSQSYEAIKLFLFFMGSDVPVKKSELCKRQQVNIEKRRALSFSQEFEMWEILKSMRGIIGARNRAMIAMLSLTGMRVGELAHIKLRDLDMRGQFIHITTSKTGPRRVYMAIALKKLLAEYLKPLKIQPDEVIWRSFSYKTKDTALGYGEIRHTIKRILSDSGAGDLGPHNFRRLFFTRMIKAGVSLEDIADFCGHAAYGQMNYYYISDETPIISAIEEISKVIDSSSDSAFLALEKMLQSKDGERV